MPFLSLRVHCKFSRYFSQSFVLSRPSKPLSIPVLTTLFSSVPSGYRRWQWPSRQSDINLNPAQMLRRKFSPSDSRFYHTTPREQTQIDATTLQGERQARSKDFDEADFARPSTHGRMVIHELLCLSITLSSKVLPQCHPKVPLLRYAFMSSNPCTSQSRPVPQRYIYAPEGLPLLYECWGP